MATAYALRLGSAAAIGAVLISCGRTTPAASVDSQVAPSGAPSSEAGAASSANLVDASRASSEASPYGRADASLLDTSAPPRFDLAAWLKQHQIEHVEHDAACATRAQAADAGFGLEKRCDCIASLPLTSDPPVDLLVCAYYTGGGANGPSRPISEIIHRALYAPDRGRLHLVLDVATGASTGAEVIPDPSKTDEQNWDYLSDIGMNLTLRAEGDRIVLSDEAPRSCATRIANLGRPDSALEDLGAAELATVKRTYASICDGPREWRWSGTTLARVKPLSH